jgi:hypothetical protein
MWLDIFYVSGSFPKKCLVKTSQTSISKKFLGDKQMVHFVKIQANITSPEQLYTKTEKKEGIKTTTVFQRDIGSQPKNIGDKLLQKMGDLFSGVKKAKHSVTLLKVAQELQGSGHIDKNVNLISKNLKTKSIRLNINVLINIANQIDLNSSKENLAEIQGEKFNISLFNEIKN